jgi:hypothetical protein
VVDFFNFSETKQPHNPFQERGFIFLIIIDGGIVVKISFKFTKAAKESNAENLLVTHDRKLAERYIKNWPEHEKHSEEYTGLIR